MKYIHLFIACGIFCNLAVVVNAEPVKSESERLQERRESTLPLKGLKKAVVLNVPFFDLVEHTTYTEASVNKLIVQHLKDDGIIVILREKCTPSDLVKYPEISLQVDTSPAQDNASFYCLIGMDIKDHVILKREVPLRLKVTVYSSIVSAQLSNNSVDSVDHMIIAMLDKFASDYAFAQKLDPKDPSIAKELNL